MCAVVTRGSGVGVYIWRTDNPGIYLVGCGEREERNLAKVTVW